jgi:glycosyltransferase involved in cell wall biosynthesis
MENLKIKVAFFFRKKLPQFNSIEELFNAIILQISLCERAIIIELPEARINLKSIWVNLKFAYKNRNKYNHITGHINYIALATGRNSILTVHDVNSIVQGNLLHRNLKKIIWFWIPAIIVKKITVISEFSKKELVELIPFAKNKIHVIYNPIKDELVFSPKLFNKEKPVILHIGTKRNKNLERTIEALKEISCKFVIIGELSNKQKELLELNKIDYSHKCFIPYNEIIEAYVKCDILSFVSTYEGFGMPIIEAQAIGRPVLTSNLGAMKEVAGTYACLVDPYSICSIKNGIVKLIEDDAYRTNLIKESLKNVERFKLDKIANEYLDLYKKMDS